jgi:hypothetical protein
VKAVARGPGILPAGPEDYIHDISSGITSAAQTLASTETPFVVFTTFTIFTAVTMGSHLLAGIP